ncbi:hypothetical protein EG328_005132 [Venturia inaequalis]|uniref:Integrase core domain-containing protein n=1 Tax=Venturia inaequalis TaxID=5025 RepID=A0A8H3YWC7_VENIN|nr:hypothetical protein EG328_005132 [Venturia inaequalis]
MGRKANIPIRLLARIEELYITQTQQSIAQWLRETHGIENDRDGRTVRRFLRSHGIQKKPHIRLANEPELKEWICIFFFENLLTDAQMLPMLAQKGWTLKKRTLERLRLEIGLRRRRGRRAVDIDEAINAARQMVREEMKSGMIDGFGSGLLYTYFRNNGYSISKTLLYQVYTEMNPELVEARRKNYQRHRGEYVVPGPNWLWSIDSYDKLKPYGIQIYACIDAYSRYIIWIYVGISNSSAVSTFGQFINALKAIRRGPAWIRSDKGGETTLLAQAHYELLQAHDPNLRFQDTYIFGTSVKNQRIEAWWMQFTKGHIFRWRKFFGFMAHTHQYDHDQIVDRIALLALYIPILREEIASFVQVWNNHYIRRQKNRPNMVPGRPFVLYNIPPTGTQNYAVNLDPERMATFSALAEEYNLDEFLPRDVYNLCTQHLQSEGYFLVERPPLNTLEDRSNPYIRHYLSLRAMLRQHYESGQEPQLRELETPTGARIWFQDPDLLRYVAGDLAVDIEMDNIFEQYDNGENGESESNDSDGE